MKFSITKGSHYSNQILYKIGNLINVSRFLSYIVSFDKSCSYILNKEDQEDINKLFGYSLGFNHNKNSARFGWFYKENTIHLYAYVYDDGFRKYKLISNLELNTEYVLTLVDEGENWLFSVNDNWSPPSEVRIDKKSDFKIGYKLWPYFGGNNPAPHDMSINMSKWD